MFKQPEQKPNFSKLDEAVTRWWKDNSIFEKSVGQREELEEFIFYDGPPFITGTPHYGTILSSIAKDVIPRYQAMQGKHVERLWGWDCHGLPIEEKVEKQMGINGRKGIMDNLDEFIKKCYEWNRIGFENWRWYVDKVGRWADMDNAYKTLDQDYMESVWWVFKQIWDKGLIYRGRRTSLFSTDSSTPVSNFEVSMDPDNYRDTEDIAVTVKFRLEKNSKDKLRKQLKLVNKKGAIFLLAWTTTPWTLPSNFALAVKPDSDYSAVKIKDEIFILAKELREAIMSDQEYSELATVTAKQLEGLEYEPLFDFLPGGQNDFKVYSSEYVTTEEGTGVLHVAPAFGEADAIMGQEWGLSFTSDIDEAGIMQVGPWRGTYIRDANPKIADHMQENGHLFKREIYVHRLPYYRYENPLIYKTEENYFVDVQKLKKQLIDSSEKTEWVPSHFREGRFQYILETAPDWSISRSRFWGTVMPLWESEDGDQLVIGSRDELMDLVNDSENELEIKKVILELHPDCDYPNSQCEADIQNFLDSTKTELTYGTSQEGLSNLRNKFFGETEQESKVKPVEPNEQRAYYLANGKPLDLHRPFIDKVTFTKDGKLYKRVEETLDGWMDSGSMPFAQFHYPFVNKEKFEQSFPGDFIAEYTGQIRAWFYVLHVISNALFEKPAFQNVLVTGVLAGTDGRKMSKSFGNYPDPKETLEKYGGDALRLYLLGSPLMLGNDMNFSEENLHAQVREFLIPLWNIYKYFVTYANQHNWTPDNLNKPEKLTNLMDEWIIGKLYANIETVTNQLDEYDLPAAVRTLREHLNDVSKWYIRRSRNRFVEGDTQALHTLYYNLVQFVKLAAPVIPFTTEIIYRELVPSVLKKEPESVHLTNYPDKTDIIARKDNPEFEKLAKIIAQMARVRIMSELGQSLRVTNSIKVRQPLAEVFVKTEDPLEDWMKDILQEELNVLKITQVNSIKESETLKVSEEAKAGITLGLETKLTEELKEAGLVREVIRTLQALRKTEGFNLGDKVKVTYSTVPELKEIIEKNLEEIKKAVSAKELTPGEGKTERKVNEFTLKLSITS